MPSAVYDRLIALLPEFSHYMVQYGDAHSIESFEERVASTVEAVRTVHTGPVIVAGWSLGGLLALKLAAADYADGLILFAATARFVRPRKQQALGWADAHVRQMMRAIGQDRPAVELHFRELLLSDMEKKCPLMAGLPPDGSWTEAALVTGLELLRRENLIDQLPHIECAALLLHGTADRVIPYAAAEELHATLPRAELVTLQDAGHIPFAGREAFIAGKIRRWCNETLYR